MDKAHNKRIKNCTATGQMLHAFVLSQGAEGSREMDGSIIIDTKLDTTELTNGLQGLKDLAEALLQGIRQALDEMEKNVLDSGQRTLEAAGMAVQQALGAMDGFLREMGAKITVNGTETERLVQAAWQMIQADMLTACEGAQAGVSLALAAILTGAAAFGKGLKAEFAACGLDIEGLQKSFAGLDAGVLEVWNRMKNNTSAAIGTLATVMGNGLAGIQGSWSAGWESMKAVLYGFAGVAATQAEQVYGAVMGAMNRMRDAMGDINLYGVGQSMMQGLASGMQSMAASVLNAARQIGSTAVNGLKNLLDIHSPSRVMAALGREIPAGLAKGMAENREPVAAESVALSKAAMGLGESGPGLDMGGVLTMLQGAMLSAGSQLPDARPPVAGTSGAQTVGEQGVGITVYYQAAGNEDTDVWRLSRRLGQETQRALRQRGLCGV